MIRFLVSTFGRFVEWVPVCPEVEVGMGTPREAIHLVASDNGARREHIRRAASATVGREEPQGLDRADGDVLRLARARA